MDCSCPQDPQGGGDLTYTLESNTELGSLEARKGGPARGLRQGPPSTHTGVPALQGQVGHGRSAVALCPDLAVGPQLAPHGKVTAPHARDTTLGCTGAVVGTPAPEDGHSRPHSLHVHPSHGARDSAEVMS